MRYTTSLLLVLLLAGSLSATKRYVANPQSKHGHFAVAAANNSNNGTSPTAPWATLDFATQNMNSGDTLYLMGGYWSEQITQNVLPWYMANLWIRKPGTYKAYIGNGCNELPTILGKQNNANTNFVDSMWIPGIMFRQVSNVTIDSLRIDSCGMAGIYFMGSNNVTITNCVITNIFQVPRRSTSDGQAFDETNTGGIYINAGTSATGPTGDLNRYCLIRKNIISDILTPSGVWGTSTNHNPIHGRGLFKSVIDSCELSHGYYGMRMKTDWDSNKVEYNYVHNNAHSGIAIGSGDVGNTFRFNVLRDNGGGIQLQMNAGDGGADSTSHNWIYNNTVEQGTPQQVSWGIAFGINSAEMSTLQNNFVFNNLFIGFNNGGNILAQGHLYHTAQAVLDYNCYWSNSSGENVAYSVSTSDRTMSLSSWTQTAPSEMGFTPDVNSLNINPQLDADLALTDASPTALKTGGYGNINPAFPLYMGAFDPNGSFGCTTPDATTLVAPANASSYNVIVSQDDIVVLSWAADNSGEPVSYRVEIADDPGFNSITNQVNVADNFLAIGGYGASHLADGTGTTHYWRVFVLSGSCISDPSNARSFVLQDLAPPDWPQ